MLNLAGVLLQVASTNSTTSVVPPPKPLLLTVVEVIVALVAIVILGTLLTQILRGVSKRGGASKEVADSVRRWIVVLMIVSGLAVITSITGLSSEFTTLTISGIGGLAVSLALQNTLSNVIAGVLMLEDGVIRLGDDLEFGPVRGEVIKLNLRTTWIKKKDGVIAVIGNSNLSSGPIINYTAMARLQ